MVAVAALAVLAPPCRIAIPAVLSDQMNLCAAKIAVQRTKQHIFEVFDAISGNLACVSGALLDGNIFFRGSPEGPAEYRHVMFEPKADIGIVI